MMLGTSSGEVTTWILKLLYVNVLRGNSELHIRHCFPGLMRELYVVTVYCIFVIAFPAS